MLWLTIWSINPAEATTKRLITLDVLDYSETLLAEIFPALQEAR